MKRVVLIIASLLSVAGCEQEKSAQIEWQLPLEAPADPHGSTVDAVLPAWAVETPGEAEMIWLNKLTTRRFAVKLPIGTTTELEGWHIQLLGLASGLRVQNSAFINDENVHNAAAFVEISRDGQVVYRGWLYEQFPELFGIDDPEWKVWLKGIILRPAS